MDSEELKSSINKYKEQLQQINFTISQIHEGSERDDLITLKSDVEQLIQLTEENLDTVINNQKLTSSTSSNDPLADEYEQFLKEMEKEGALEAYKIDESKVETDVEDDFKSLEGMKCQAPHVHSWGDTVYHNAMVCGVITADEQQDFNDIQVRVMFTNPTHQEMLPCPYFLDGNCKFPEERCKFSHGEPVLLSKLQEYREPNFDNLKIGNKVLAKRQNNLWQRAIVKKLDSEACTIKFESNQEEHCLPIQNILPLDDLSEDDSSSSGSSDEEGESHNEYLIQRSLLTLQPSQKMGGWEKHTKGIGSKLMEQMGYVVGTGLGRRSDGRLEPVQAVVLPSGKSLDHCMTLRENAGGDENLFSVERRLQKLQRQQEIRNKKAYEREKNKKDVFEFLNDKLVLSKDKDPQKTKSKNKHRQEIKSESNRDLNVASLKIDEDMRRIENEMIMIKQSLSRHNNPDTAINKNLRAKLQNKQEELKRLEDYSKNVSNEQNLRRDKKKLTVF